MHRLAFLIAIAFGLSGMSSADAAARYKQKVRAAPAHGVVQPVAGNRPHWAAPQQCFTDEGYGRFTPCDVGDGR